MRKPMKNWTVGLMAFGLAILLTGGFALAEKVKVPPGAPAPPQ